MALINSIIDIANVIDSRNRDLWNYIISNCNLEIVPSLNDEHRCHTQSINAKIFVPINNICPDSFTHELLHIDIHLKNLDSESYLKNGIIVSNGLSEILVPKLLEHIDNCLEHIKMFPIYMQLGFARNKFLFDYSVDKCTDDEIRNLKSYYRIGDMLWVQAVEVYLGKYFSIKADYNPDFDYTGMLIFLKEIDEILFNELESFMDSWMKYDFGAKDSSKNYKKLVDELYEKLNTWAIDKEFINLG